MAGLKPLFSHRHRAALFEKKSLKPSFTIPLRIGIEQTLARFSHGTDYVNWTYESASDMLCRLYGWDRLTIKDGDKRSEASFVDLIVKGYPSQVLDAVEAWFACGPQRAEQAASDLNTLLVIHESPWRFLDGEAVLVDSGYLHDELIARTATLLKGAGGLGPLEEFQTAVSALQAGEHKRAIVEAHKSVESVMKHVLGTHEHWTFGRLLAEVIKSGLLPEYYEEFLHHFDKLALGAVKARNRPGTGHGQGSGAVDVPRSLAQFAIHLAGCINVFLIEHWIEQQGTESSAAPEDVDEDDVPF